MRLDPVRFTATTVVVLLGLFLRARGYLFDRHGLWLDEASWALMLMRDPLITLLIRPIGFMSVTKVLALVADSGLPGGAYDLVVSCLVDEHLADVAPLYREAWRLARAGGQLVLVGFHPHFIMASGMPTHFDSATGEPIAIETHVHLLSEHVTAGLAAGWTLEEMRERVIDDTWLALKPKWASLRGHPVTFAMAWRKPARAGDR